MDSLDAEVKPVVIGRKKSSTGIMVVLVMVMIPLLLIALGFVLPNLFAFFLALLRYSLTLIVILFLILSVLVIIGLRTEARSLLLGVVNGTLSTLDLVKALGKMLEKMIESIRNFLYSLMPIYALILNVLIYFALIYLYKYVGKDNDVTFLTALLSSVLVIAVSFLNKPTQQATTTTDGEDSKLMNFKRYFSDIFEVILFIFFLTMDSTSLFFLPDELNAELHAQIGNYNLMTRGIHVDSTLGITLNLIFVTLVVEILRQGLRLLLQSKKHISEYRRMYAATKESVLKMALRQSITDNIDDLLKFVTYFTFLLLVFLFFPRLKLFAMAVASVSSLISDLLIPERLTAKRQEDLIGRMLSRAFRI